MSESDKNKELLQSFRKAFEISKQYVEPQFELAIRLYKLWKGQIPSELEATYTHVNLPLAHSTVQERIPKHLTTYFSTPDFISLDAKSPRSEFFKDQAELWLRDLLTNKFNLRFSLFPTIQDVEIFGNGYRRPQVIWKNGEPQIVSGPVNYFQVLPAPNGGLVNPYEFTSEAAVDYVFIVDWLDEDRIKKLVDRGYFNKEESGKLLAGKPENQSWTDTYRDQVSNIVGGITYDGPGSWRQQAQSQKGLKQRRRCVFWMKHDKLTIVAEDRYVLYDGPPILPDKINIVNYRAVRDGTDWFGISSLEMIEDILLAIGLNLNMRLEYLIRVMCPTKWIRQDIHGMHSGKDWTEPNATFEFPDSVDDIRKAIHYDRLTDVPQQAFLEDTALKFFMQEIGGMPNYSKGMAGAGALGNETATGITSLISQASARFLMEAEQLEYGGLKQECEMLLQLGSKFITDRQQIRDPMAEDGFGWTTIEPEQISDNFTVRTHGTAYLTDQQQNVQKMLAWVPILLNQAQAGGVNVNEVLRQGNEVMDVFPDPDDLFIQQEPSLQVPIGQGSAAIPGIGGMAAPQNLENRNRSVENRNTVEGGTGRTVPANFAA